MTPFPWDAAMRFGLGVLRLPSHTFWQLTPRELAAAVRGRRGPTVEPMRRDDLDALMRAFPDDDGAAP